MWDSVRGLVRDGTTVLLTTQYLDEADQLADEISVVDHGRVIAAGTAAELKAQVGGTQLEIALATTELAARAADALRLAPGSVVRTGDEGRRIRIATSRGAAALADAVRELDRHDIEAQDIVLRQPTLDDVFLTLTGQRAEEEQVA